MCEQALNMLFSMPELQGYSLTVVDVANDSLLTEQYGARLPVLDMGHQELAWPFDAKMVKEALSTVT